MFNQILDPTGMPFVTWLVALVPVALLLILLAVFRMSAWLAVLIGSAVTFGLAVAIWQMPVGDGIKAYAYGSLTGIWAVNWITLWGVMLFNTLQVTGVFEKFRRWLISQGTADVRVQTMLFAWAFGALLEGLVGFGYPWAFVAPILISLDIPDRDAIRVAAIANNAPVSYGALGAPIIALAAVTSLPLMDLSASVGHIVAVLALLPPWVLLFLVTGWRGMWEAWPLAVVGSLSYIAGQLPVAVYLGPYLPDVAGAIVCFACLLLLLKVWRPATMRGYGGTPMAGEQQIKLAGGVHGLSAREVFQAWLPFIVLIVIVVLWTGPWSSVPHYAPFKLSVAAGSSLVPGKTVAAAFSWRPASVGPPSPHPGSSSPSYCGSTVDNSRRSSVGHFTRCGALGWSASSFLAWPSFSIFPVWPRRWLTASRRLDCCTSWWRRSWASSALRCRAPTPRPTPCSVRSRCR